MIVPLGAVQTAARMIEQKVHQDGWDQQAMLMRLEGHYIASNKLLVGAIEEPLFRHAMGAGHPGVCLRQMADHMGDFHLMEGYAKDVAEEKFCGFVFVVENWMRTFAADEVGSLDQEGRGRKFADIPGSIETRSVTIVDTSGRITFIDRQRGKPAHLHTGEDGDLLVQGGRAPASLRDMVLAVALHMPLGTADLDALRGIELGAERG